MDEGKKIQKLERENDELRNLIHSLVVQFGSVLDYGERIHRQYDAALKDHPLRRPQDG